MNAKEFNRLLKLLTSKPKEAMETLFEFYFKRIVFYLKNKYGLSVAEDAAQIFFLSLYANCDELTYVEYPTTWVYTCCENHAKRIIENDNRIIIPEETHRSDIELKEEIYGELYEEIKKLDKLDQDILFENFWLGYNFEEIAMMHNCKSSLIRQRYHRIIKKFNKLL